MNGGTASHCRGTDDSKAVVLQAIAVAEIIEQLPECMQPRLGCAVVFQAPPGLSKVPPGASKFSPSAFQVVQEGSK